MRARNPFEGLINQFLSIPDIVSQGVVRRGESKREDEIREEDRNRQDERFDEVRQQQLEDEARAERQAKTNAAQNLRLQRVRDIQESLAFLDPSSEQFGRAMSAIDQLSQPMGVEGQEALDSAIQGKLLFPRTVSAATDRRPGPDGAPVETAEERVIQEPGNVNTLIGELGRARREEELRGATAETLFTKLATDLADVKWDAEERTRYLNNVVLPSPILSDDQKSALAVTAGMKSEDAEQMVANKLAAEAQNLELGDIQIGTARTQRAIADLQLSQGERMADLDYQEAEERVRQQVANGNMFENEAFLKYGILPEDEARAERVADRLGIDSLEEAREQGQARYGRIQEHERIELDLQREALKLSRLNITGTELNNAILNYNRDRLTTFGHIEDVSTLATRAFAAAANGDTATVLAMKGLAGVSGPLADALVDIPWEFLEEKATQVIGDGDATREYEKAAREETLLQFRRGAITEAATFANAIGSRFLYAPEETVEGDIEEFIGTLTSRELESLGGEEAFRNLLAADVRFQRRELGREQGGLTLELLSKAIPESASEQAQWRDDFILAADKAGLGEEAGSIANGLLSGANLDYWEARLRRQQLQLQVKKLQEEAEGGGVDLATMKELRQLAADQSLSASRELSSAKCQVANPSGGVKYNQDDPDCVAAAANLQEATSLQRLYSQMLQPSELRALIEEGGTTVEEQVFEDFRNRTANLAAESSDNPAMRREAREFALAQAGDDEERKALAEEMLPLLPVERNPSLAGAASAAHRGLERGVIGLAGALYNDLPRFLEDRPSPEQTNSVIESGDYGTAIAAWRRGGVHSANAIERISAETGVGINRVRTIIEQQAGRIGQ